MDNKRLIQNALNRSLSGLQQNPYLAQRVIEQAKGVRKMKKKSIGVLVFGIVLVLAMLGTAYALFSSHVAEFFGNQYGQEMGDWLQTGRIAQLNDTVDFDDISVSLDEIVCKNRGIYGVGTVRTIDEKNVLITNDEADCLLDDQNLEYRIELTEANANGGHVLSVLILPERIGVDEGTMLIPASVGYYDALNEDGSLTFSFEVEDGAAVEEGVSYQMELSAVVVQIDDNGSSIERNVREEKWMVNIQPAFSASETATPVVNVTNCVFDYDELAVPNAYHETGTLPIYQAVQTDLSKVIDPEWFNQTGIVERNSETGIVFEDHAVLQYDANCIYYTRYSDEMYDYNTIQRERFGLDVEPMILRVPALSDFIYNMAADVQMFSYAEDEQFEQEQLTYLSLRDAQHAAEEMLKNLELSGYVCSYALDMNIERIHRLGEKYNHYWHESEEGVTNQPRIDYSTADVEDEGYYLIYTLNGNLETSDAQNMVSLFIDRNGIAVMNLRNAMTMGDAIETPEALIAPDEAIATMAAEAAASLHGKPVESIHRVSLVYRAVQADNKAEGMIFVPVWHIEYIEQGSNTDESFCWGEINAVNGKLINANFR